MRIAHTSDLHVDDLYSSNADLAGTDLLSSVLKAASGAGADLLVAAGDTFESNRVDPEVIDRAGRMMAEAPMQVILLPGNHDPCIPGSAHHRIAALCAANIHILGVTCAAELCLPGCTVSVAGAPHRGYGNFHPLPELGPRPAARRIVVAHGHFEPHPEPRATYRPGWLICQSDLDRVDADYLALGHWNTRAKVGGGALPAVYSGAPDVSGSIELVTFDAGSDAPPRHERIPVALSGERGSAG